MKEALFCSAGAKRRGRYAAPPFESFPGDGESMVLLAWRVPAFRVFREGEGTRFCLEESPLYESFGEGENGSICPPNPARSGN